MAFGTPMAMSMMRTISDHQPFHHHHHHHHEDGSSTESFTQVPSIEIMSAPGNSVSETGSCLKRRNRDTGFPEPFNEDRNTTLPYPGADLSPNARITMDGHFLNSDLFSSKKSFRRSRLNKHKRTVSYGKITPQFEALHSVMSIVDATSGMSMTRTSSGGSTRPSTGNATPSPPSAPAPAPTPSAAPSTQRAHVLETPFSASFSSPRTSREGGETDSFGSKRDEETPPSSPDSRASRKGGFMSRWRRLSRG